MLKVRSDCIDALSSKMRSYIEAYTKMPQTCKYSEDMHSQHCQAFLLGQLIRASRILLSWPSRVSVQSLMVVYMELNSVDWRAYAEISGDARCRTVRMHQECNIDIAIQQGIKTIFNTVPSPVLESHRIHMQVQWKKGNPDPRFCGTALVIHQKRLLPSVELPIVSNDYSARPLITKLTRRLPAQRAGI